MGTSHTAFASTLIHLRFKRGDGIPGGGLICLGGSKETLRKGLDPTGATYRFQTKLRAFLLFNFLAENIRETQRDKITKKWRLLKWCIRPTGTDHAQGHPFNETRAQWYQWFNHGSGITNEGSCRITVLDSKINGKGATWRRFVHRSCMEVVTHQST
ncbi:hypothetical protein MRX96_054608 [Rhipicephalus microplus]